MKHDPDIYKKYLKNVSIDPLFFEGNALKILKSFQDNTIDFCMTSPPYWAKREYDNGGVGLEKRHEDYIDNLFNIFGEVKRVLKNKGSFWLNIGDSYNNKRLLGIPWRLAFRLSDEQGWILRNNVIWNKVKGGPDNTQDRLRNVYENIFHFVKIEKGYYYDVDAIRSTPKKARVVNGVIVSATGVSGVRYKRQIELSTELSSEEKEEAFSALDKMLTEVAEGKISDFRMIIRGQQRTTHSNSTRVSGRAKELLEKGFYFLKYHPNGSKPSDVWDILPEDTQKRKSHFAPYPEDLCKIPILATCPPNGVVLDPFCGTGTTMLVAKKLGRKSIGIDISDEYIKLANERCMILL
ncbi:MAG: site-specific DNA-methyltransferase [Candidatus Lokiarchaeota archaeon]|nr:site-specific DNA-methyltransferase [Candidatus Lokiarchaeota archaeon]